MSKANGNGSRVSRRPAPSGTRAIKRVGIKRNYEFTAGPDGGSEYTLRGIPSKFWRRVRQKATREQVSVRSVVLSQLRSWVDEQRPRVEKSTR